MRRWSCSSVAATATAFAPRRCRAWPTPPSTAPAWSSSTRASTTPASSPATGCPSTPAPTWRCSWQWRTCSSRKTSTTTISWSRTRTASRSSPSKPRSTRPSGPRRSPTSRPRPSRSLPAPWRKRLRRLPSSRVGARSSAVRTRTRSRRRVPSRPSTRFWAAGARRAAR